MKLALEILFVCSIAIYMSFVNAQQTSCVSDCSIYECSEDKYLNNFTPPPKLHINIIYQPPPILQQQKQSVCHRIKEQLCEQSCACTSKKTQTDVETSADTVFMRYPKLLPEVISPKILNQFAAASLSQNVDSKINILENFTNSNDDVIKYRAYLQLAMTILRAQSKDYRIRLPQYLQAMENIDFSTHPQAELLKSDLSFIRAYLSFEQGNIEKALYQINRAIKQDPQMLNARLLHTTLLVQQFDSLYQTGIYNSHQCLNLVDELFRSTGNIIDLMPCPHQAIAFASELDGWTKQNRVSTLITHTYLYKIAHQDTYLSNLITQNVSKFNLPSMCTNYLYKVLNDIKNL